VLVLAQIPHWAMLEHMHYKGRVPQERIGASPAARRSLVRLEMRLLYVSQETITAAQVAAQFRRRYRVILEMEVE
jgi:hypothetical protein